MSRIAWYVCKNSCDTLRTITDKQGLDRGRAMFCPFIHPAGVLAILQIGFLGPCQNAFTLQNCIASKPVRSFYWRENKKKKQNEKIKSSCFPLPFHISRDS